MIEKSRQLFPGPKPPADDQPDEEQAQTHGQFGVPNPASLPNDYQQSTEETGNQTQTFLCRQSSPLSAARRHTRLNQAATSALTRGNEHARARRENTGERDEGSQAVNATMQSGESIYNLIPQPVVAPERPPMHRSKYPGDVDPATFEFGDRVRKGTGTFGRSPGTIKPKTDAFLKRTSVDKLPSRA